MILGEAFYRRNIGRLAEAVVAAERDALLLTTPANIVYATGFYHRPSERPLAACVWANGNVALFVPYLEAEAAGLGWARDIRWYPEYPSDPHPYEWMAREAGGQRLAIDAIDARGLAVIRSVVDDVELSDAAQLLRRAKQPEEVRLIAQAAHYADLAVERLYARLTTGATERDLAAAVTGEVDALMRRELTEQFAPLGNAIVGAVRSGPRAALPEGLTSARRLTRGDLVVAEFTADVGGYHAQAGSTFFMGDPLRETVRVVEATLAAQAASRAALTVGASCADVDRAARGVLTAAGLGGALRRRTGHGLGLERHEAPWLAESDAATLAVGMVATNSPAVYLPGRLGVREIETVVVEEDGARVLNPRSGRWRDLASRLKEF